MRGHEREAPPLRRGLGRTNMTKVSPVTFPGPSSLSYARLILQLALRLAPHPVRALRALRAGWSFRARGWLRTPPFLPLPPRDYIEWRLYTAYGAAGAPTPPEVERYLRWVDRMRKEAAPRE